MNCIERIQDERIQDTHELHRKNIWAVLIIWVSWISFLDGYRGGCRFP